MRRHVPPAARPARLALPASLSCCSVSEVERGTFHLRVDTSTLVAVIAAKFTEVEMVRSGGGCGCSCGWVVGGVMRRRHAEGT